MYLWPSTQKLQQLFRYGQQFKFATRVPSPNSVSAQHTPRPLHTNYPAMYTHYNAGGNCYVVTEVLGIKRPVVGSSPRAQKSVMINEVMILLV